MVKALPNTSFLPVPKSAPAGHTTAAAHLLWQVFPRYPCLEYKDNSGQSCPVRYTWTASFGPGLMFWQKWFNLTPQFVAYQFPGHLLHPHWYFTAYSSICQVLLGALSRRIKNDNRCPSVPLYKTANFVYRKETPKNQDCCISILRRKTIFLFLIPQKRTVI